MKYDIKWLGLDFGFTIGNPKRDIETTEKSMAQILSKHGITNVDERIRNFRSLLDKAETIECLIEQYREDFLKEVLDSNPEIIKSLHAYERSIFEPTLNVREALRYVISKGIECAVITDAPTEEILCGIFIERLETWELRRFFSNIYSPAGAVRHDGSMDYSYRGKTKRSGKLYDLLVEELRSRLPHIDSQNAAIVGDDIISDIEQPKIRGFRTFQYIGAIDRGESEADQKIENWLDLIRYV